MVASGLKPSQKCTAASGVLGQISRRLTTETRKPPYSFKRSLSDHIWTTTSRLGLTTPRLTRKSWKMAVNMVAGLKVKTYEQKLRRLGCQH